MSDGHGRRCDGEDSGSAKRWRRLSVAAMKVLWAWVERHGIPKAIYVDWKNIYVTTARADSGGAVGWGATFDTVWESMPEARYRDHNGQLSSGKRACRAKAWTIPGPLGERTASGRH